MRFVVGLVEGADPVAAQDGFLLIQNKQWEEAAM